MMLDFIWHLRGSAALGNAPTDEVLDGLARLLEKQRKPVIERGTDYLVFDHPLWSGYFGRNWLAMVIYDRGIFWIEQREGERRLRYDLRSLHGFLFCLFAAVAAFFFGLLGDGWAHGLKFGALAFGWLYGMNLLLALARVPSSIEQALLQGINAS